MALLMKSIWSASVGNSLLKGSCYNAMKVLGSSFLHTTGAPTVTSYTSSPPIGTFGPNLTRESLLSTCEKLTSPAAPQPAILPSRSDGKASILDLPALSNVTSMEMPTTDALLDNAHIMPEKIKIEEPESATRVEKLAHRMLVLRKKKMKKHKRKKLRRKVRIIYARIRLARKALKEKNLQTKLLNQMNESRGFCPKKYAFDLLSAAYEKVELPPKHKTKLPWEV